MRTDEELMQAYVRGDRRAFDALHRRYHPILTGVLRRYVRSTADVEDLVQLTFLKLHRARESYRIDTPLRPWLFMIARNVRKDYLRASRQRIQCSEDVEELPVHDDPCGTLERRQDLAELSRGLSRLSSTLRRTIEMHFLREIEFAEIARHEHIPQGTVRVRAHRGCAQLRAFFAEPRRTKGRVTCLPQRSAARAFTQVA